MMAEIEALTGGRAPAESMVDTISRSAGICPTTDGKAHVDAFRLGELFALDWRAEWCYDLGIRNTKGGVVLVDGRSDRLERFSVSMPSRLLARFDECVRRKGYESRSEAVRDIVRDFLVAGEWRHGPGKVVGTVTLVYDHHAPHLSKALAEVQHRFGDSVVCTTHVHLDADNCLEVIVLRGSAEQVREISDRLIGTKGVKHGKLACTTTGETLL